jgi:hypothetical protein
VTFVPAQTFADAAAQIVCGQGRIDRFDFVDPPQVDPSLEVNP